MIYISKRLEQSQRHVYGLDGLSIILLSVHLRIMANHAWKEDLILEFETFYRKEVRSRRVFSDKFVPKLVILLIII